MKEKPDVLSEKKIETIIRKVFPLFELNEEGEEDRKETTLSLLKAQRDADVAYYEPLIQQRIGEIFEAYDAYIESLGTDLNKLTQQIIKHEREHKAKIQSLKSKYLEVKK